MPYVEKVVEISTADTDTNILTIPANAIGHLVQIEIRNPNSSSARVRLWDSFEDTDGNTQKVLKLDWDVGASTTEIVKEGFDKAVFGTLIAQSSAAGVVIYVRVLLE